MHGADDCGPAVAIPELAAVVAKDGNPANPWRASVPALPGCYLLARTNRDAVAKTQTVRWYAACLHSAELVGLVQVAPSPVSACGPFEAEGTWALCEPDAYIGDALSLRISSTGPDWNLRAGRPASLWACRADQRIAAP